MNVRKRLGELLIEAKKLTKEQLRKALSEQSTQGGRIGEHLVNLGFISEETLYLTLSKQLKIPVIPEEKMARMNVPPETIALIPQHFAEKNLVFPIQFDRERASVSVAMVDPSDTEILGEIKIICQTEKVKRYLAQKSSIQQAIKQYYGGAGKPAASKSSAASAPPANKSAPSKQKDDTNSTTQRRAVKQPAAAAAAKPPSPPASSYQEETHEVTHDTTINPEIAAEMIARELLEDSTAITTGKQPPAKLRPKEGSENTSTTSIARIQLERKSILEVSNPNLKIKKESAPPAPPPPEESSAPKPIPQAPARGAMLGASIEHRILLIDDKTSNLHAAEGLLLAEGYQVTTAPNVNDALQCLKNSTFDLVLLKSSFSPFLDAIQEDLNKGNPLAQVRTYTSLAKSVLGDPVPYDLLSITYFQTVDYLVSLLERKNPAFRRYAYTIAKYSRLVAQRLNLSHTVVDEIYLAAYLQDIWKNFEEAGEEKQEGEERRHIVEIFSDMNCPYRIVPIIEHISEFYNGTGKPQGLKEEEIPIGSRIISVVRAFEEMMRSSLVTGVGEAPKVSKLLRKGAGKKFDPKCVEAFVQVLEGESFLENVGVQPIVSTQNDVLIVDKDPEATSLLELRLINEGFSVQVARDGQHAWRIIEEQPPSLIISDVVLPKIDGFNLCEMVKGNDKTKDIPFIFVSSRTDDFNMTKGLEMGADDYQTKPANVPFLITKVRKLMESRVGKPPSAPSAAAPATEGVSGNLSQMGLVEIIQILGGGSKTAFLKVKSKAGNSAELYLERGRIVAASSAGKKGEEAFYELMTWNEGNFSILPDRTTSEKNINNSTDYLLLEAMRRIDEANAERTSP